MNAFELSDLDRQRLQGGKLYLEFLRVPALSLGLYVLPAGGVDAQQPHGEDEVYYVVSGRATIRVGDEDENRPVGTVAHHVAVAIPRMAGMVRTMVAGQEVQRPSSERNAAHAQANPDPDQAETVALLRRNAGEAAQMVRGLSEADLSRTGRTMLGEISAADAVARALVGHVTWHEGSIRATLGH